MTLEPPAALGGEGAELRRPLGLAIFGGLISYPVTLLGALFLGVLEAFSSFWASAYKEVIVFTMVIPVLLWRSFGSKHVDDEE